MAGLPFNHILVAFCGKMVPLLVNGNGDRGRKGGQTGAGLAIDVEKNAHTQTWLLLSSCQVAGVACLPARSFARLAG